jgi:hypothetical protein
MYCYAVLCYAIDSRDGSKLVVAMKNDLYLPHDSAPCGASDSSNGPLIVDVCSQVAHFSVFSYFYMSEFVKLKHQNSISNEIK